MKKKYQKVLSPKNNTNIFIKHNIFFLIQLPFETPENINKLQQELSTVGLHLKKTSRAELNQQFQAQGLFFFLAANSNYLITDQAESQKVFSLPEILSILQLLKNHRVIIVVFLLKELNKKSESCFDQGLIPRIKLFPQTPATATELYSYIQNTGILPIFRLPIMEILNLLKVNKTNC